MPRTPKTATTRPKGANQPGRPTAVELERRKTRVIEVATGLFVANGYAGTSLIDIARGAGVATRTLYQHFGDKEALFREVVYARDSAGALDKPDLKDGDTLIDALARTARYALDVTYQPQSIGLMRLMIAESQRFPDFMKQVANSIFARFQRNIEKMFIALEQAGAIPAGDHKVSAELFGDMVHGSHPLMTYTGWQAGPPGDDEMRERIEFFVRGRFGEEISRTAATARITLPREDQAA